MDTLDRANLCTCVHDCRDCFRTGDWHQHADDPCMVHPDAEVS